MENEIKMDMDVFRQVQSHEFLDEIFYHIESKEKEIREVKWYITAIF